MPEFSYQALDRGGATVTGTVQADSVDAGAERVRQLGLFPMSVAPKAESRGDRGVGAARVEPSSRGSRRLGRGDVVHFTRQLADLVDAGLPLDRALTVLIRQAESSGLSDRLTRVQEEVRSGRPLSEALAAYPREFSTLYVNMVHAGEATGQLAEVLERLATYLEREMTRRSQLVSALTYPVVLVSVAVGAAVFLVSFVVPRLSSVFDELGHALPLPTLLLLGTVNLFTRHGWQLGIALLLAVLAARQALATPGGRAAWDQAKLRLPLGGKVLRRVISSRFARSLGTMLGGGVPILSSLEIAREAVGNVAAARAVDQIRDGIRQGESLAAAMDRTGFFLPVAVHMAGVGEETGRLPAMLVRTADSLDFEIDSQIRRLVTLVEPVIVLLMGAFVGFVVLSILLPIFEANMAVG